MRMDQKLCVCLTTPALIFWVQFGFFGFRLPVFRQPGPPQRVDCLVSVGNKLQVYNFVAEGPNLPHGHLFLPLN